MTENKRRDNSDRKQIRFGRLLALIDAARGKTPLAAWVKKACEEKLISDQRKENEK